LLLLLSFAVNHNLQIHQLDVRSAFLTCPLNNTVTLVPPQGYKCPANTIFELKKAILYGLKKSSLVWYTRLIGYLSSIRFKMLVSDPCVFYKTQSPATWVYCHVDDLVIISKDPKAFKTAMEAEFDIKYLGEAAFLLGMNIERTPTSLHIHQTQYTEKKLLEFGFNQCNPASCPINPREHLRAATAQQVEEFNHLGVNYRALIGSLNCLSVLTRPDISYAFSVLSQHFERPGIQHFYATKQVFCYLLGTKHVGLVFLQSPSLNIRAHVDLDWGNFPKTQRSVTRYAITTARQVISWKACRQSTLSLSSTEAEHKALSNLGRELAWLNSLVTKINLDYTPHNIEVDVDNQGAIDLARSKISQNGF
jgi:hypothetical protein